MSAVLESTVLPANSQLATAQEGLWNCSAAEYHADTDYVSNSQLKDFRRSPALFFGKYIAKNIARETGKALEFGDIFHEIVLTPQRVITAANFGKGTVARFSRCDAPERSPEFESAGSRYWHTPEGLIRESDHWGYVRECWWTLEGFDAESQHAAAGCGFCPWERFFYSDRFKIIPPDVLASNGARQGNAWKEFAKTWEHLYLFKDKEFAPVGPMVDAINGNGPARNLLFELPGRNECTITWICRDTGIPRKARLDRWVHPDDPATQVIVDVKTTTDCRPAVFAKTAYDLGYHRQAAYYQDAVESVTGERPPFVFVVTEKDAPNGCEAIELSQEFVEQGREENLRNLRKLKACRESGVWQTETHGTIVTVEAPGYAKFQREWEYA